MQGQIRAIVVRESEGFFDDQKEHADLQNTIRIACEFYLFLQKSDGTPEVSEVDYVAGTIRSGLDEFFSMSQTGRILAGLKLKTGFGQKLPNSFSELKASYDSIFHQLLECTHSAKAIGLLLSLVQMMLLFMAVYFPSFSSFSSETSSE